MSAGGAPEPGAPDAAAGRPAGGISDPGASESAGPGSPPASDATLPGTTATRRPWPLAALLTLLAIVSAIGLWQGVNRRAELSASFPKLSPLVYDAWLAGPALTIVGCVGLWFLRRWGLWAVLLAWAIVIVADVAAGATSHALFATAATWLVIIAVRPVRHALR
jgi:hypothetical protein